MNAQFGTRALKRIVVVVMVNALIMYTWLSKAVQPISKILGPTQRTVVVYSGPTSLDGNKGKNFMYLKNLDYYIQHGISCASVDVGVDYIVVLTQEVASEYLSDDGLIAKRIRTCQDEVAPASRSNVEKSSQYTHESSIEVIVREDRCYDMESIRIVMQQKDLSKYDNMVFLNCGMVGPKIGPHSPLPPNIHHWTQVFTSLLNESVHMSGLSINPCLNKSCKNPHVQSFLYATSIDTLRTFYLDEIIYDCAGNKNTVVQRYEIGMSGRILNDGYQNHGIAVPYMSNLELGKQLYVDRGNIQDLDSVRSIKNGDIWFIDSLRMATSTMNESDLNTLLPNNAGGDHYDRSRDILPWEFYIFFKVSRFVPHDIQVEMEYDSDLLRQNRVKIVPNKCC